MDLVELIQDQIYREHNRYENDNPAYNANTHFYDFVVSMGILFVLWNMYYYFNDHKRFLVTIAL